MQYPDLLAKGIAEVHQTAAVQVISQPANTPVTTWPTPNIAVTKPMTATERVAWSINNGIAIVANASPNAERVWPSPKSVKCWLCQ